MVTDQDVNEDLEKAVGNEGLKIIPYDKNPQHVIANGGIYGPRTTLGRTLMAMMWSHKEGLCLDNVKTSELLAHQK